MEIVATRTELETLARSLVSSLAPHKDRATLVTLSGELGAGKTAFVQACARELGVTEDVTSPTFVIENRYLIPSGGAFSTLVHIDAYRLDGKDALGPLRFEEDVKKPDTLIMLEWPEQVEDLLPTPSVAVTIQMLPDGARQIDVVHSKV